MTEMKRKTREKTKSSAERVRRVNEITMSAFPTSSFVQWGEYVGIVDGYGCWNGAKDQIYDFLSVYNVVGIKVTNEEQAQNIQRFQKWQLGYAVKIKNEAVETICASNPVASHFLRKEK
jgi:hypothetical protein